MLARTHCMILLAGCDTFSDIIWDDIGFLSEISANFASQQKQQDDGTT